MISSTNWVPRGFASEFPEKYDLSDEEVKRINQLAQLNLDDAKENLKDTCQDKDEESIVYKGLKNQFEIDDDLKEFDMENYDDSECGEGQEISMFPGFSGEMMFHEGEDENDPFISLTTKDEEYEEKRELQVYPTDNMVLATRTEDDISYLDIYIYDDGAGFHDTQIPVEEGDEKDPDVARGLIRDPSLYVHHNLMLPAFPLCVEWVNYKPGIESEDFANFAAIGTFDPSIEIWDLDCVDKSFPDMILGDPNQNATNKKPKKKKKKGQHITSHHTDAVLSLSHNKLFRAVLLSTSADCTVKLWDLNHGTAVRSIPTIHAKKAVSSSQWHLTDGSVLLTGGYDSRVALSDVRISDHDQMSKYWSVNAGEDIENVIFANDTVILAGTDAGNVYSFDLRNGENSSPIWTLNAHDSSISSLSVNSSVPNMLTTSAVGEKVVKLWNAPVSLDSPRKGPSMVLSRDFGVGNVLTTSFAPDLEVNGTLVIGGVNPGLKLWDVFTNRSVRKAFGEELNQVMQIAREKAKKMGCSSRIARKYTNNNNSETIIVVDDKSGYQEEDEKIPQHN